jgi:hypothetical protein
MNHDPIVVFFKSIDRLLSGRARFPRGRVGQEIVLEDGRRFTVFREVRLEPKPEQPAEPDGVFRVWFHTRMSPSGTILLSYLTLLGFLGLPGFRSKLWLLDEAIGDFGGIYEWDTVEDAANYEAS